MIATALNITDPRSLRMARRKGHHHCIECRKMINNTPTLIREVTPLALENTHYDVDGLLTSGSYRTAVSMTEHVYHCKCCGFDNVVIIDIGGTV